MSSSCGCMNGSPPTMPKKTLPIALASVMSRCMASGAMVCCLAATSTQQPWQRLVDDRALAPRQGQDLPGEVQDGDLVRIAEVDRPVEVRAEQAVDPLDQVLDVAEAARLRPVAVDGQWFAAQRLAHEVRQHP